MLVWKLTPSRRVRTWYFSMYCWLVRGKSRIVEVDGVTLDLDLSEVIDVAVFLQRFERELVGAIHAYTRSGDVVLDIGANAGVHSMVMAKCAAPGMVFAFEPTRRAYARLQRNAALNPALHVVPVQVALSDENATATTSFRSSWRTDRAVHSEAEDICFRRLDDWIEENRLERVDLVKLDVDGFEYRVLHGAPRMLAGFKPTIFMEVGHYHFADDQTNPVMLLSRAGYHFWDAKTLTSASCDELRRRMTSPEMIDVTINVIASTSDSLASLRSGDRRACSQVAV
jgi:FkbM family methyltransferase